MRPSLQHRTKSIHQSTPSPNVHAPWAICTPSRAIFTAPQLNFRTPQPNFYPTPTNSHALQVIFTAPQSNFHASQLSLHAPQINFRTSQTIFRRPSAFSRTPQRNFRPPAVSFRSPATYLHVPCVFVTTPAANSRAPSHSSTTPPDFSCAARQFPAPLNQQSDNEKLELTTDGRQSTARGRCINLLPYKTCVRPRVSGTRQQKRFLRGIKLPVRTAETLCPAKGLCQDKLLTSLLTEKPFRFNATLVRRETVGSDSIIEWAAYALASTM